MDVNVNAINGDTCDVTNFQAWLDTAIGSDDKNLISADAQNLEDTLDVNVGAIAGDSCNVAEFAAWINAGISPNDQKSLVSTDAAWITADASAVVAQATAVFDSCSAL